VVETANGEISRNLQLKMIVAIYNFLIYYFPFHIDPKGQHAPMNKSSFT